MAARMKITMHATLVKQFQEALGELEQAQELFNLAARNKTGDKLRMMADKGISDEAIDQCIDDPQQTQLIAQNYMMGHTDTIKKVEEIKDRVNDIKILEENIMSMHKLFLDLAALVHAQGELLNSVENHVDKASDYIKQGEKALVEAKKLQESTRSRKCCVIIICLVIVIIAVVVPLSTKL